MNRFGLGTPTVPWNMSDLERRCFPHNTESKSTHEVLISTTGRLVVPTGTNSSRILSHS